VTKRGVFTSLPNHMPLKRPMSDITSTSGSSPFEIDSPCCKQRKTSSTCSDSSGTGVLAGGDDLRVPEGTTLTRWGLQSRFPKLVALPEDRSCFNENPGITTNRESLENTFDLVRISFPHCGRRKGFGIFHETGKLIFDLLEMRDTDGGPLIKELISSSKDYGLAHAGFALQCGFQGSVVAALDNPVVSNMLQQIVAFPAEVAKEVTGILTAIISGAKSIGICLEPTLDFICEESELIAFCEQLDQSFLKPMRTLLARPKSRSRSRSKNDPYRLRTDLTSQQKISAAAYTYLMHEHQGTRYTALTPYNLAPGVKGPDSRLLHEVRKAGDGRRRVFTNKVYCSNIKGMFEHLSAHFKAPRSGEDIDGAANSVVSISCGAPYDALARAGKGTLAILLGVNPARSDRNTMPFAESMVTAIKRASQAGARIVMINPNTTQGPQDVLRDLGMEVLDGTAGARRLSDKGAPFAAVIAANFDPLAPMAPVFSSAHPRQLPIGVRSSSTMPPPATNESAH
jgi:hypothetical protein